MDSKLTNNPDKGFLADLKQVAVNTNKEFAKRLKINQSTAITCVKPSGTVSQLVDSASGIHTRHNPYYIRTVRCDKKDPLTQLMIDQGVPNEPDITKPDSVTVFSFPTASPPGSVTRNDMSAIQQLELWLEYQREWCEHKPSVTVSVKEDEWMEVGSWVYKYFDEVSGISFLPYTDHIYKQAPYQDVERKEYLELKKDMPSTIDFSKLVDYESEDNTTGSQELACTGGVCELVDVTAPQED
jgi:ribonucleoside-diphosphate reductase alpha chain